MHVRAGCGTNTHLLCIQGACTSLDTAARPGSKPAALSMSFPWHGTEPGLILLSTCRTSQNLWKCNNLWNFSFLKFGWNCSPCSKAARRAPRQTAWLHKFCHLRKPSKTSQEPHTLHSQPYRYLAATGQAKKVPFVHEAQAVACQWCFAAFPAHLHIVTWTRNKLLIKQQPQVCLVLLMVGVDPLNEMIHKLTLFSVVPFCLQKSQSSDTPGSQPGCRVSVSHLFIAGLGDV